MHPTQPVARYCWGAGLPIWRSYWTPPKTKERYCGVLRCWRLRKSWIVMEARSERWRKQGSIQCLGVYCCRATGDFFEWRAFSDWEHHPGTLLNFFCHDLSRSCSWITYLFVWCHGMTLERIRVVCEGVEWSLSVGLGAWYSCGAPDLRSSTHLKHARWLR